MVTPSTLRDSITRFEGHSISSHRATAINNTRPKTSFTKPSHSRAMLPYHYHSNEHFQPVIFGHLSAVEKFH